MPSPQRGELRQTGTLLLFLIVTFAAAGLGSFFTASSIATWYPTLQKPSWNPPNWIFAPVWTALYVMMAVAAWQVWRRSKNSLSGSRWPLSLFFIQLALNAAWSGLFFGLQNPGLAFIEILFLWSAILLTAISFFRRSQLAGGLLLPYLLWVAFAAALNFEIWRLNS